MKVDESEYDIVEMDEIPSSLLQRGSKKEVNLVLQGGGSRATNYLGAIEAMVQLNVTPKTIFGNSGGAMFSLYIGTRTPLRELKL